MPRFPSFKPTTAYTAPYQSPPPPQVRPPPPTATQQSNQVPPPYSIEAPAVTVRTSRPDQPKILYRLTPGDVSQINRMLHLVGLMRIWILIVYLGLVAIYLYVLCPLCVKASSGNRAALEGAVAGGTFVGLYLIFLGLGITCGPQFYMCGFRSELRAAVKEGGVEEFKMDEFKRRTLKFAFIACLPCFTRIFSAGAPKKNMDEEVVVAVSDAQERSRRANVIHDGAGLPISSALSPGPRI